jgi:hypothetical protein
MKVTLDLNWEIKSNELVIVYYDLKRVVMEWISNVKQGE